MRQAAWVVLGIRDYLRSAAGQFVIWHSDLKTYCRIESCFAYDALLTASDLAGRCLLVSPADGNRGLRLVLTLAKCE